MGLRFSKRINIGKGFGINISKSGITPSLRTKFGSISTKGFSASGFAGLGYRKSFGNPGCLLLLIIGFAIVRLLNFI